jgi:NADP-dependent 3-hydroxy acid dehydrogenase YdfG
MVHTEEFTLKRLGGDQEAAAKLYDGVEHPLVADDVARVITGLVALPGHINIDLTVMRPVAQAAQHKLVRGPLSPRVDQA